MLFLDIFNPYSVVLVGLGVTVGLQGRQAWLIADFFASTLFGLMLLIIPRVVLGIQTDVRLDSISVHMARTFGSVLITSGLNSYVSYVSNDEEVKTAHVRSRTTGNIILLIAMIYAQIHYSEWTVEHIKIGIVGVVVWTIPYLIYYFRPSTNRLGRSQGAGSNPFLLIDSLVTFTVGASLMSFPQWILRHQVTLKLNGVSVHIARSTGALVIASGLLSDAATYFQSRDTQKAVLLARGLGSALLALSSIVAQVTGHFATSNFFVGIIGTGLWVANAFLGYMIINYETNVKLLKENKEQRLEAMHAGFSELNSIGSGPSSTPFTGMRVQQTSLNPFVNAYDVAAAAMGRANPSNADSESASSAVNSALGRSSYGRGMKKAT